MYFLDFIQICVLIMSNSPTGTPANNSSRLREMNLVFETMEQRFLTIEANLDMHNSHRHQLINGVKRDIDQLVTTKVKEELAKVWSTFISKKEIFIITIIPFF